MDKKIKIKKVKVETSEGIGFSGLLCIAFIILKLTSVISWSWWWVLSPVLIPAGIGIAVLVVMGIIVLLSLIIKRKNI